MGRLRVLALVAVWALVTAGLVRAEEEAYYDNFPSEQVEALGGIREDLVSGEIIEVDVQGSVIQVKSESGSVIQLFVDPYATVIWKDNDYVDSAASLVKGDRLETGYFDEGGRLVAGWIDVLGKEN